MRLAGSSRSRVLMRCGAATLFLALPWLAGAADYDPLAVAKTSEVRALEMAAHDAARTRDIPVLCYLPAATNPAPVVLFSHGLGGSREGNAFLGQHWAARGYVAVFVQHPGSDDAVWRDAPPAQLMEALRRAASLENFFARVADIHSVLDRLQAWNTEPTNQLYGRLDLKHVAMSGHSFGAVTTEAVSGETFPLLGRKYTDSRIEAAIMFSPSPPRSGGAAKAFGSVKIPWLLLAGTKDASPLGGLEPEERLKVYPALPSPKYEAVLANAEHSAFTDRALPGDHEPRNPNHHRVMLALTTAFLDAYLKGNAQALAWLNGSGPRSILQADDRWEHSEK